MEIIPCRLEQWTFNRERTLETLISIAETSDPVSILGWQPGPGRAHIAWQMMHIAVAEEFFAMMQPEFKPSLSQEVMKRYGKGSQADEQIPSLDEVRHSLEATRRNLLATMDHYTDEDLEDVPASLKERGWNLSTALKIVAWHEAHHQGQAHMTFNLWKATHGR